MKEPTFDKDGYPTEETLQEIRQWKNENNQDAIDLLRYIQAAWYYPDRAKDKDGLFVFSTGGWSGNESLIQALQENSIWFYLCWNSTCLPGGFLCIATEPQAREELEEQINNLVRWVWKKVRSQGE